MSAGTYTSEQVKKIIPHRYPFLFIDRVIDVTGGDAKSRVGRVARCIKNVTINEPFFEGHFPNNPIMPGVLLVEAMAQAGAIACFREGDSPSQIVIASISYARFRKPVIPGDSVLLVGKVAKERGPMVVVDCEARVNDQVVAETQVMAHVTIGNSSGGKESS